MNTSSSPEPYRVTLAMRPSPDWRSLSHDYRADLPIDPARYLPDSLMLGFPEGLVELIDLWNRNFAVDFFSCRMAMKDIAGRQLDQVRGARRVSTDTLSLADLDTSRDLVFFHDDDDWFAPDLARVIAAIESRTFDVCVFPLVRLWTQTHTFVRPAPTLPDIAGRPGGFSHRYQSNNYGVVARLLDTETFNQMREHMRASPYAEEREFTDLYINQTLGVTAKTPVSASMLHELRQSGEDALAAARRYVKAISALKLPEGLSWLRPGIAELAELFARAARLS